MNAVIYARFSSHSQREQSIEGQLKTCYKFAEDNGYTVIEEYIDRAQSGTNDNRSEFQRMITDSDKHTFDAVLVYQLDRFARNRYDSAINKAKLKKNGVRVISARENIADDASGILVEGILESMAEYYSAELSQKIHRGMSLNAQKCLSNGSNPGLGFKVAKDHTFYVDEDEAAIVREIFERYGRGETVADIIKDLNARQIKTSLGRDFNKNSLHRLLRNKCYIGTYLYKGEETPGGMPRIVDDAVFERVQKMLDKNKAAPARSRGKEEYLLTTKLFCGYCREMMIGYGGTGKSGKAYHYYACKNAKKHLCQKKAVDKKRIEDLVIVACRQMLTDSNIKRIAEAIDAVCKSDYDSSGMKRIKTTIREVDVAIENLWQMIEKGQGVDAIMERINKRQAEKAELEALLAVEAKKERIITAQEVGHFLALLQKGDFNDTLNRRAIVNIFVNKIYLFDDKFRLMLNGSGQPVEIDNIMLDEIEEHFDSLTAGSAECSSVVADAPPLGSQANSMQKSSYRLPTTPPRRCERHVVRSDVFIKSHFSLILSQFLSKSNPLSLGFDLVLRTASELESLIYRVEAYQYHPNPSSCGDGFGFIVYIAYGRSGTAVSICRYRSVTPSHLTRSILRDMMYCRTGGMVWNLS